MVGIRPRLRPTVKLKTLWSQYSRLWMVVNLSTRMVLHPEINGLKPGGLSYVALGSNGGSNCLKVSKSSEQNWLLEILFHFTIAAWPLWGSYAVERSPNSSISRIAMSTWRITRRISCPRLPLLIVFSKASYHIAADFWSAAAKNVYLEQNFFYCIMYSCNVHGWSIPENTDVTSRPYFNLLSLCHLWTTYCQYCVPIASNQLKLRCLKRSVFRCIHLECHITSMLFHNMIAFAN